MFKVDILNIQVLGSFLNLLDGQVNTSLLLGLLIPGGTILSFVNLIEDWQFFDLVGLCILAVFFIFYDVPVLGAELVDLLADALALL